MTFHWKSLFSVFEKHETRPTPHQVYNWRIYCSAIVASWVAVIIGYDAGFAGGMVSLGSFTSEFGLNTDSAKSSWTSATVISLFQAGAFFGALGVYPLAFKCGRVISLWAATFFLLVGGAIQLIPNAERGLGGMYAGRFLSGFGIGAVSTLAPMYISEVAPQSIRGQLIGYYEIAWQIGGIFGFWINYGTSINIPNSESKQWQIPVALQLIPSGMFALGLITLTESPRWLFSANKREQGIKNLCYLRNLPEEDDYIQYEIRVFDEEVRDRNENIGPGLMDPFIHIAKSPKYIKRLALSTSTFIMQNSCGINAINYYSPKILQTMGLSSLNSSLLSSGVFGLVKGLCCFIWSMCIVDRFGRRPSMCWGFVVCSFCMWYIGAYIKIANPTARTAAGETGLDSGGQAALAFFYIWTVGYGLSWSGTPWVWNSEVFPSNIKNATSAINASSNWFWAFILARFASKMISTMTYGIFFFFAAFMTVFFPCYFFFYPETKNIPIEYMDELFLHKPWKAHGIVMRKIAEDREREFMKSENSIDGEKAIVEQVSLVDNSSKSVV